MMVGVRSACVRSSCYRWDLAASGTRRGLMLGRSVGTPTALRCSVSRPVAELTPLASPRYAQTGGDKSVYERAPRGAASPERIKVPEIAPAGHRPPRAEPLVLFAANRKAGAAKVRSGRSEGASSALRSGRLVARARSAHQHLTCRRLFERRKRSERTEFGDGPRDRAPEGSRSASGDRRSEALRPAGTRLCSRDIAMSERLK